MTALRQYQRLESSGLWRDAADAQRREVVVKLGDATLILSDPRSGAVVTHWSLPAIQRRNPGQRPALFAPGPDVSETLELTDDDMIAALRTVQGAVRAATPRPGRLRGVLVGSAMLAIGAVAVLWLPDAILTHTASVIPAAKRAEIGQRALDDVTRLTGAPCTAERGLAALAVLSERIFGPKDTPILYVLRQGLDRPAHLPGGVILLPRALVETGEAPDALAGAILAEGLAADQADPVLPILTHAGVRATFDLLTTGDLPAPALDGYGEVFLRSPPPMPDPASLLARFEAAQVPATPYAGTLGTDPRAAALVAGDPFKGLIPSPLLPDDDWIALQAVCSG